MWARSARLPIVKASRWASSLRAGRSSLRALSSSGGGGGGSGSSVAEKVKAQRQPTKAPEDDLHDVHSSSSSESPFSELIEPRPIQSLNIRSKIEKMEKPGSIFGRYFMGGFDEDLLSFPFLLKTRAEFLAMNDQYEMVRCTWNKIAKNEETLDLLGYHSLYNLSVSEMVFIFEAIGASIQKQFAFGTREDGELRAEKKMAKSFQGFTSSSSSSSSNRFNIPEAAFRSFSDARDALETIVPLITRNSLVYYALSRSSNPTVRELFLGNGDSKKRNHRIALALSEPTDGGQSSYFHSWSTEARLTYDHQHWVVSGEKWKIPVPPASSSPPSDYSHYLVFARTSSVADGEKPYIASSSPSEGEVGVVGLLVPAEEVEVIEEEDGTDYFGLAYRRLRLRDVKLPRQEVEVVKTSGASGDAAAFLNVKGAGQLATGAVILGLLKQLLRNTYAHLVNEKLGLASSDLMQFRLYQATNRIYRLESMLYMTAAMYDCFEPEGASGGGGLSSLQGPNLELEAVSVKVAAAEAGQEVCSSLRAIFGSRHPFASTALDLVYALDAGLLDSSMHNRVLVGRRSVQYYTGSGFGGSGKGSSSSSSLLGRSHRFQPKAPIYSVLNYLKYRRMTAGSDYLTRQMTKFAHHNLHAACEWIESCLNRLEFANSFLIGFYGEETLLRSKQVELNRLATLSMDIFAMISVLSRANHALCYGLRNGDAEKELALAICKETFIRHLALFEELTKETMADNDQFAANIAALNRSEGGVYFASLFRPPPEQQ